MTTLEILTASESRAADASAVLAGVPSFALMRAAGEAAARAIHARFPEGPVTVLCGPGNNGGDGYVAAAALAREGRAVRVRAEAPPATEDARRAAALWGGAAEPLEETFDEGAVIVDALFGVGLTRPLEGAGAALAARSGAARGRLAALDLPSGLDADTGRPIGEAFQAALTVAFHRKKPAHVLLPGRVHCGEVVRVDIGAPQGAGPQADLFENAPELWATRLPWPDEASHKHARGRLGVVGGGATSTGAARLAARAGLRGGAGLVRLFCAPQAAAAYAPTLEAVMLQPFEEPDELARLAEGFDAMVIGPAAGVDEATVAALDALSRTGAALVVDADALSVFRGRAEQLFARLDRDDVLTPHPGEFERVFPGLLEEGPERITAARRAAERAGAVVLLKGADTVVAAPDGRCAVNTVAAPWLATAGSGDVLAGLIGAWLAQQADSFDAACAAVWTHAEAARRFGPGLTAEDLPDALPPILRRLWEARAGID